MVNQIAITVQRLAKMAIMKKVLAVTQACTVKEVTLQLSFNFFSNQFLVMIEMFNNSPLEMSLTFNPKKSFFLISNLVNIK
jgi:hypothetical protein